MSEFAIWAPRAGTVEVEVRDRRIALEPAARGYHVLRRNGPSHGDDYALFLDGEGPFPDPRSPWQPAGPHGPSRHLDHDRFAWSDAGWRAPPLSSGVVYELHVGTFTPEGTFAAAIERLDHLVDLGVSHVELMPVAEFPGRRGWGYDGVSLFAPHHGYGGPEGLKRLVSACHSRGLAVLLDVVYNHLGPDGNYLGLYGPYFIDRFATPWGDAVNFDAEGSDEVRRFFVDNALAWLRDYHFDGLRIDAVHAILDQGAIPFLEQLATEVRDLEAEVGRPLVLVAESDLNDPRLIRPPEAGGIGLDAQWSDDFHHALHALLTGEREGYYRDFGRLADVAKALVDGYVYDGRHSEYRGRSHGRPLGDRRGSRLLGYLQNHDQVGNRARGDRLSATLSEDLLRVGATLVLTAPFVPMLFMGEEWGARTPFLYFTDHTDAGLGEAVREGRRREFAAFGWDPAEIPDPQAAGTFERSRLDWDERDREEHRGLLAWYRALVALRKSRPDLSDGRLDLTRVSFREEEGWLRMDRGRASVALNFSDRPRSVPVPAGVREILLASKAVPSPAAGAIAMPPASAAVLARSPREPMEDPEGLC